MMKKYFIPLVLLFIPALCFAAISADSTSTSASYNNQTTVGTSTITIGGGANGILFMFAGGDNPHVSTATPPTFAGQTMTQLGFNFGVSIHSTDVWYLLNPTAGLNNATVTINTAVTRWRFMLASYFGVDQTNPIEASSTFKQSTNATLASSSITTITNNAWAFEALAYGTGATVSSTETSDMYLPVLNNPTSTVQARGMYLDHKIVSPPGFTRFDASTSTATTYTAVDWSLNPAATAAASVFGGGSPVGTFVSGVFRFISGLFTFQ